MTTLAEPPQKELTPRDTAETLQRILRAVEKTENHSWVEVTTAILLSLATTASAWCAYEASRWSGVQTFRLAAANTSGRKAADANLAANQARTFEASMLISYLEAQAQGNEQLAKLLHGRFRPDTKKAIDAWLKLDPFHNPAAPENPFKMPQFTQPELVEAREHSADSAAKYAVAEQASATADNYVLLTVLFASVLFFGGIGSTFNARRLRMSVLVVALVLFAITVISMARMPVCWE